MSLMKLVRLSPWGMMVRNSYVPGTTTGFLYTALFGRTGAGIAPHGQADFKYPSAPKLAAPLGHEGGEAIDITKTGLRFSGMFGKPFEV
ncbi:hypothetical protein P3T76_012639 [Phytophthora citrophthora]|uniref:Uncharacterized protein n=1 Tax=Phytophthora citrophthora TaxID=4793 RepID=A0AAD9G541_9STRA|nr:hypothetical protein P3T76_012639 [Phytophthora citrophthora]